MSINIHKYSKYIPILAASEFVLDIPIILHSTIYVFFDVSADKNFYMQIQFCHISRNGLQLPIIQDNKFPLILIHLKYIFRDLRYLRICE
jgi:hypothetical protein